MFVVKGLQEVFSVGKNGWELKLAAVLNLVALQKMRRRIPLQHCN
jgi:hypothetical protein